MVGQALDNNVLLEIIIPDDKSAGGIIIPKTAQQQQTKAIVVSIGENVKDNNITVGALIYMVKGADSKNLFEHEGKSYSLIKDYDALMIMSKSD